MTVSHYELILATSHFSSILSAVQSEALTPGTEWSLHSLSHLLLSHLLETFGRLTPHIPHKTTVKEKAEEKAAYFYTLSSTNADSIVVH